MSFLLLTLITPKFGLWGEGESFLCLLFAYFTFPSLGSLVRIHKDSNLQSLPHTNTMPLPFIHTTPLESATTECYSLVLALVVPGNEVDHAVPSRPCQIRMVLCPGAAPALTPSLVQRTAPRDGKPTTHPHMIQADKLLCTF